MRSSSNDGVSKKPYALLSKPVILDQTQKLTIMAGHILKCAKRVFGIPEFTRGSWENNQPVDISLVQGGDTKVLI